MFENMTHEEMQQAARFIEGFNAYQEMKQKGLLDGSKVKAASSSNTAQLLFGGGGLFTGQGLESDIITAYVRPEGISAFLKEKGHIFPSLMEQPMLGLITGIQDDGAAAVANPCDNAPSGYIKACNLFFQFGRLQFDTATIEFDKIFTALNSGVNTDLRLRGRLLGLSDADYPAGLDDNMVISTVVGSEMVKVGMLMARGTTNQQGLTYQYWQGDVTQASSGGGYIPMAGLDSQITTGQVDAQTNTPCPAVNSDVKDFGLQSLYSNNANNTPNIVWYLSQCEYYLRFNAQKMGLAPVEWALAMNPNMWQEFVNVWPIAYNTNRGAELLTVGNTRLNLDGRAMREASDQMREQQTVAINGRIYPVVVDDGIAELTNITTAGIPAGSYAGSIYFVPLTINGGFPVTYMEYKDYRIGMTQIQQLMGKQTFWTDGGMFSWALDPIIKWCFKMSAKTERRIICRAPQLAGRIDRILYSPLQHLRSSQPGSAYELDGGVSIRTNPTRYAVWQS